MKGFRNPKQTQVTSSATIFYLTGSHQRQVGSVRYQIVKYSL